MLGWYSLIHLAASELPDAVAALARPLAPGGWLVLAMHAAAQADIGVKLHAQRAREAGATNDEIYGVILLNLGVTTGVTQVQRMITWVDDALAESLEA